jgi:outer membrane protein assembly factor BamE (lipoprotein component of BamABCDE complex)
MKYQNIVFSLFAAFLCVACAQTASWHANEIAPNDKQTLTVGSVQRNIRKGMPSYQVAEQLGSPNIVSTDEQGREVWIYDKFSTEEVVSASNGLSFNLKRTLGGAARTSQSTMTVILKFDGNKRVRDIAYHTSRF